MKKLSEPIPKENVCNYLVVGDLATRSIDQLSTLVDEVFVPLLSNEENYCDWPEIVAQDVQKQVHNLKSTVYQVKGQVNGETILAMPVGVDKIVKVANELEQTKECVIDLYLKGAIEGVVIKWVIQVNDVYTESPSNAFNGGQNPLPQTGKRNCGRNPDSFLISNRFEVGTRFIKLLFDYRAIILEQSLKKFHTNL